MNCEEKANNITKIRDKRQNYSPKLHKIADKWV